MRILVVAATLFEIRPFVNKLHSTGRKSENITGYSCPGHEIDVLITGVGMVPTAYYLGRQLAVQRYDLSINAGIAGTFSRSLSLGAVVQVVEDCVPELGAEDGDNFLSVFELGLSDPDATPYQGGKLVNNTMASLPWNNIQVISKLPHVKAITSNTVRGSAASIARILRIATADIESMEGAAFFYACLSEKVPCLQIRAVSNYVEERDKSNWNLDLALKNLNKTMWKIVSTLPN
ncbi:MAG: futalosine hydrolase [Bacteroidales bacterium]